MKLENGTKNNPYEIFYRWHMYTMKDDVDI